jgi:hypothetical protein
VGIVRTDGTTGRGSQFSRGSRNKFALGRIGQSKRRKGDIPCHQHWAQGEAAKSPRLGLRGGRVYILEVVTASSKNNVNGKSAHRSLHAWSSAISALRYPDLWAEQANNAKSPAPLCSPPAEATRASHRWASSISSKRLHVLKLKTSPPSVPPRILNANCRRVKLRRASTESVGNRGVEL